MSNLGGVISSGRDVGNPDGSEVATVFTTAGLAAIVAAAGGSTGAAAIATEIAALPVSSAAIVTGGTNATTAAAIYNAVEAPFTVAASGAAPVLDLNNGRVQKVTVSASATFGVPLHPSYIGETLTVVLISGGTYTVAFNAIFRDAPSTYTSTVGQKATVRFVWDGTSWQFIGGSSAFA